MLGVVKSSVMWGDMCLYHNLWTTGTAGQQCVLSAHSVQFVSVMSSVLWSLLRRNVCLPITVGQESDSNISSLMSCFLFVAILNTLQHNLPHNRPNILWLSSVIHSSLEFLTCHMLLLCQGMDWTVVLKTDISVILCSQKLHSNP